MEPIFIVGSIFLYNLQLFCINMEIGIVSAGGAEGIIFIERNKGGIK